ncbi:hypothetical protein AVEN_26710-1, partial [Araneus ventricosus]
GEIAENSEKWPYHQAAAAQGSTFWRKSSSAPGIKRIHYAASSPAKKILLLGTLIPCDLSRSIHFSFDDVSPEKKSVTPLSSFQPKPLSSTVWQWLHVFPLERSPSGPDISSPHSKISWHPLIFCRVTQHFF